MILDHPELVTEFKYVGQFEEQFYYSAMSLDGQPIYEEGDVKVAADRRINNDKIQ